MYVFFSFKTRIIFQDKFIVYIVYSLAIDMSNTYDGEPEIIKQSGGNSLQHPFCVFSVCTE